MSRARWPVLVRRGALDRDPRPAGGAFRSQAVPPFPVPPALAREFGVFCVDTTERVVALTYDDGPHPEHTPRLLDVLARAGATATFFVLGQHVARYPEVTQRVVAEGHEVALHGEDHRSLLTLGDAEAVRRIGDAKRRVEDVTGVPLRLYRPPYGRHTVAQARGIRGLGLELVIWSGDAHDWLHDAEDRIARRALHDVFPGGIVLLHDDRADPETLEEGQELPHFDRARVLVTLLDGLAAQGYRTSTVGGLLREHRPVRSRSRSERPAP
ncbi:polysaccharide deacetylase family protein [Cellulosimicrobium cellulans]|uniref:polysaccharide deacetylase family protein n=1 Tax=Cellulosimicrobium cellulans TaxID=1710 RepID=UPI0036EFA651